MTFHYNLFKGQAILTPHYLLDNEQEGLVM